MIHLAKFFSIVFGFGILFLLLAFGKISADIDIYILYTIGWLAGVLLLIIDEMQIISSIADRLFPAEDQVVDHSLVTRSIFFMMMLPFMGIYIITSTGSLMGLAFIFAIMTTLLAEMTILRRKNDIFRERFLSSFVKKSISDHALSSNDTLLSRLVRGESISHLVGVSWVMFTALVLYAIL